MNSIQYKQHVFVSDLHGDVSALNELIRRFQNDEQTKLVVLGDYTDGYKTDNHGMVTTLMHIALGEIKFANDPVFLLGNHDEFILRCATIDDRSVFKEWSMNGGNETLEQLGYEYRQSIYWFLNDEYETHVTWLKSLPLSYETPDFYAVHAGLDMTLPDPRETSYQDKIWIRDKYYNAPNTLGKIIISGHTPTQLLGSQNGDVVQLKDKAGVSPRFVIDGGAKSSHKHHNFPNLLYIDAVGNISEEKLTY